jgi:hypothetical protein
MHQIICGYHFAHLMKFLPIFKKKIKPPTSFPIPVPDTIHPSNIEMLGNLLAQSVNNKTNDHATSFYYSFIRNAVEKKLEISAAQGLYAMMDNPKLDDEDVDNALAFIVASKLSTDVIKMQQKSL